jgi:hypothetical protein
METIRARRAVPAIALILGAGLALRFLIAFVVAPGQGLASDLGLFGQWATALARVGPGGFYEAAGSSNYPPGYMYVLWLVGLVGQGMSGLLGISGNAGAAGDRVTLSKGTSRDTHVNRNSTQGRRRRASVQ